MDRKQLKLILKQHKMWLMDKERGSRANLSGANLSGANLSRADLSGANLYGAKNIDDNCCPIQCPEYGKFIGWKKCYGGVIVKLQILEESRRSSATSRKCRCDKALVVEIIGAEEAISSHDHDFIYRVGETVSVDDFCSNRWKECAAGIHFFITKAEAENY